MSSDLRSVKKPQEGSHAGSGRDHRPRGLRGSGLDAKVELIRSLIPLGLMHVESYSTRR